MPIHDDDDPLWKRIFLNEILWVVIVILVILAIAFHLATAPPDVEESKTRSHPPDRVAV